ncbi:MAG: septal ring lytic transglycosylase RlpA family protein [Bradymonadales bacterium]|jgi:rare lipoprotein A
MKKLAIHSIIFAFGVVFLSCSASPKSSAAAQASSKASAKTSRSSVSQARDPSRIYEDRDAQAAYARWLKNNNSPSSEGRSYEGTFVASWYGPGLNGNKTASGEIFDMYGQTAAHKKLPFGSIVRVTSLRTKKSVVVRINDRGPFTKGRTIDLSYGAAHAIDMIRSGVEDVKIEIIRYGKQ